MVHKDHVVSLVFLVMLLCVPCTVDFVKASIVTEETYSKHHFKTTMTSAVNQDASAQKRRSIQEHGNIGQLGVCSEILGTTSQNVTVKRKGPCEELVVWVPKKSGFTEFVKVNQDSKVEGGFSIAIFCHALDELPFSFRPIFRPFVNDIGESNGTYDELLRHIEGKTCEAVAGDVTIRSNRAKFVDFTPPYLSSEVYMLVHATHQWSETLLTFLRPFTWRLWIALVFVCIFTGVAVAILECRVNNPKFAGPFYRKLIMVIWFPVSTFFFLDGKIFNRCSKVVLVVWLSMIFIVIQVFTASLSSYLTIDQLRPKLPSSYEHVGYQNGSFLEDFIIKQQSCHGKKPMPLESVEDFKNALSNGSINVIFDELPYIEIFLATYGSDYMKFGPLSQEPGIAFAFPQRSPLYKEFSRAVINVTESPIMMEMKKKYLLFSADKPQQNKEIPQSLDVQSFIGLFLFMGIVTITAVISSEITLLRKNHQILPVSSVDQ